MVLLASSISKFTADHYKARYGWYHNTQIAWIPTSNVQVLAIYMYFPLLAIRVGISTHSYKFDRGQRNHRLSGLVHLIDVVFGRLPSNRIKINASVLGFSNSLLS
jgi:hypothetical protein